MKKPTIAELTEALQKVNEQHKMACDAYDKLIARINHEYVKGDKVYWRGQNPGYGIINEVCRYYPETSYNVLFVTGDNEVEYPSCHVENLRHVDADEWKSALIEEAKRRYKIGDKIQCKTGLNPQDENGTWAEIITEKTSDEWIDLFYKQLAPLCTFLNKHNLQLTKK